MNSSTVKISLLVLMFCFSGFLSAQNVAFVSQDSILASIPDYKMNLAKIDSLKNVYRAEIKEAKDKVNDKLEIILASYMVQQNEDLETLKKRMTANDVSKLELLLEEDKFIEKKVKNFDLLLSSEYAATVQPIIDKVNNTIENYAVKNKLYAVYILEQMRPALAYYDRKKDITQLIIKTLIN